jgi:transketolase
MLVTLYFEILRIDPLHPDDPDRDRLILSKGHGCSALYATLVERGFASPEILETFYLDGGQLAGHPIRGSMPGIEASTGSLGHGLSLGVGLAIANRFEGRDNRVFVVMGDGECNEGSIWEAAMFAAAQRLDHLVAMVDYNKLQGLGRSEAITQLDPLADKWRAFGWDVYEIDGHDFDAIREALASPPRLPGRPRAIIAHTIKGKGVSFMEDQLAWHYKSPNDEQLAQARQELGEPA